MSTIVKSAVKEFPTEEYLKAKKTGKESDVKNNFTTYLYNTYGIPVSIDTERPSNILERLYYWLNAKIMHPKEPYFGHDYKDTNKPIKVTLWFDKEVPMSEKDFWSAVDRVEAGRNMSHPIQTASLFLPSSSIENLEKLIYDMYGKLEKTRVCHDRLSTRKIESVREIFQIKLPGFGRKLSLTAFSIGDRPDDPKENTVKSRYYIETPTNTEDKGLMETLDHLVETVNKL